MGWQQLEFVERCFSSSSQPWFFGCSHEQSDIGYSHMMFWKGGKEGRDILSEATHFEQEKSHVANSRAFGVNHGK